MGDDGVGVVMQAIGFFYNTETFKKNGWAPPCSWNDLLDKKFCRKAPAGAIRTCRSPITR